MLNVLNVGGNIKKKLLCWCDFIVPTGFANVAKHLLQFMHQDFDVSVVGINYSGNVRYDTEKYFVYPTYHPDMLGVKRLLDVIEKDPPDVIFLFQDIFHISDIIKNIKDKIKKHTKIVVYFPIDGSPFSKAWGNVFSYADVIITYTDWAVSVIKDQFPNLSKKIHVLYHGADTTKFYPFSKNKIESLRTQFGWSKKFTVINVNRYQPRKAIPLTLRAFSMFAKGYKVCKCGNHMPIHTPSCDLNMCPKSDIVATVKNEKNDVFLYLHMMPQEFTMGPGRTNLLQHHAMNAGFTDQDHGTIFGINGKNIYNFEVNEETINEFYNAANLNISTAIGEGFGLSLIESMATGTASLAPRNSAIPEVLKDTGYLVNNNSIYCHPMDSGHIRPVVDTFAMSQELENIYKKWNGEKDIDHKCIDTVEKYYLWDDKQKLLKNLFLECTIQ